MDRTTEIKKMNTDMSDSTKREKQIGYPVIDRNPAFSKVVDNFNTLDYLSISTITGLFVIVGNRYRSVPVTAMRGLVGLFAGVGVSYQHSFARLAGFLPNHDEVARFHKK